MKRPIAVLAVLSFVMVLAQGCSSETNNDLKRDINKAARDVDDKVKDAVD